jgi:hypothetical protein
VLVSDDRNDIMPLWYLQYVEGRRPDLLGLFPLITPDQPTIGPVLDLALGTGRPVYLIKDMPGIEVKVEVTEETGIGAGLQRVWGPAVRGEPDHPRDDRLADALMLAGYDRLPSNPAPGDVLQVDLYWQPLRPLARRYHTYVHLVDAGGQAIAQKDQQPGGVYYPTTLWQPGERLLDTHLLQVPAGAPPGVYHLVAGAYAFAPDGTLEPLGQPLDLGSLTIEDNN